MQLQELNALLAQSDQFAISPTAIDRTIPSGHDTSRSKYGPSCPFGLIKATVLEVKHPWTDQTSFGCLGKTHAVERTTGVLVRLKRADLDAENVNVDKLVASSDHVAATIDNPNVFQLVIARKAVLMPWSDYQPVRDHRRKTQRETDKRMARLNAAKDAIGGESAQWHRSWDESRKTNVFKASEARVTISLARAEEIAVALAEHGIEIAA